MEEFKKLPHYIRLMIIIIFSFSLIHFLHKSSKIILTSTAGDFAYTYFHADLLKKGNSIYSLNKENVLKLQKKYNFKIIGIKAGYHPIIYMMIIPLTFLTFKKAFIIWSSLHILLFFLSFLLLNLSLISLFKGEGEKIIFLMFLSSFLFLNFGPFFEHLALGQLEIPVLFFFSLSLYFHSKKRYFLEGFFFLLPIFFKPQFVVALILYILFYPSLKVWKGIITSGVIINLFSISIIGINQFFLYIHNVFFAIKSNMLNYGSINNHSIQSMAIKLFGISYISTSIVILSKIAIVILLIYLFIQHKKLEKDFIAYFSTVIILLDLISPYVQNHYLVVMIIPLFLILSLIIKLDIKTSKIMILYTISYIFIALQSSFTRFPRFHKGFLSLFTNFPLYGTIMLLIIMIYIIEKKCNIHS